MILCQRDDEHESRRWGFDLKDDTNLLDFDITSILPPSIERLYIHGLSRNFSSGQWDRFTKLLTNLEVTLPNLKKLRIQKTDGTMGASDVIGNAKNPPDLSRNFPGNIICSGVFD